MAVFRIIIADDETISEGEERHPTVDSARRSAIRSALNILSDRRGTRRRVTAVCEIKNDRQRLARRFDVTIAIGPERLS